MRGDGPSASDAGHMPLHGICKMRDTLRAYIRNHREYDGDNAGLDDKIPGCRRQRKRRASGKK